MFNVWGKKFSVFCLVWNCIASNFLNLLWVIILPDGNFTLSQTNTLACIFVSKRCLCKIYKHLPHELITELILFYWKLLQMLIVVSDYCGWVVRYFSSCSQALHFTKKWLPSELSNFSIISKKNTTGITSWGLLLDGKM